MWSNPTTIINVCLILKEMSKLTCHFAYKVASNLTYEAEDAKFWISNFKLLDVNSKFSISD